MATYPSELVQDAAYQGYTSRLTELWSLPKPAQGLNTYKKIIKDTVKKSLIQSGQIRESPGCSHRPSRVQLNLREFQCGFSTL